MTIDEFKNILSSETDIIIEVEGETFSELVQINEDIKSKGLVIKKCTFENQLQFNNIDLGCGIHFDDCTFNQVLIFQGCRAKNYNQPFNIFNGHIAFLKCSISFLLFKMHNKIERDILIGEETKVDRLDISTIESTKGSLKIESAEIQNLCDIRNSIFNSALWISNNSIFNSKVRIENVNTGSLVLNDSIFKSDIYVWAGKLNSLTFNGGEFHNECNINAVLIEDQTTIVDTEFKKSISFKIYDRSNRKIGSLRKLYVKSGKFKEPFIIEGIENKIEHLNVNFSRQLEGEMIIKNVTMYGIELGGDNHNSNLVFNNCIIKKIFFNNFYNYSGLTISSCSAHKTNVLNKGTEFKAVSSNFGKAQFFNLNLDSYEKVILKDIIITELIASNIKWFKDNKLNSDDNISSEFYNQKREIYRQIKYALEDQGDKINSLEFKAKEMSAHKAKVFYSAKWPKPIMSKENFILWVGETNNFGQNWIKAAGFAILFSVIFHFLIVVGISEKLRYCPAESIQDIQTTWKVYLFNINSLPMLMNPTHILSRIFPNADYIGFWPHFFDYLQKIFMTFFIFQVVVAFRKFMK